MDEVELAKVLKRALSDWREWAQLDDDHIERVASAAVTKFVEVLIDTLEHPLTFPADGGE